MIQDQLHGPRLINYIRNSLPQELDIFHHLYFSTDSPLLMTNKIVEQTRHEQSVGFVIQGDIQGQCLAFVDTYQSKLNSKDLFDLEAAFTEGINIILGKTLTKLEQYKLLATISPPKTGSNKLNTENHWINLVTNYKMYFDFKEYHVRMVFQLKDLR